MASSSRNPVFGALSRPFRRTAADFRDPDRSATQKVGIALSIAFTGFALLLAIAMVYVIVLIPTAPSADELRRYTNASPSVVLAADGSELTQFERGNQVRVTLDDVAPVFFDALITVEDQRFYQHQGVDWRRIVRAGLRTASGRTQGGSTITQQLARNLFPEEIGRQITMRRKVREIITAYRIERSHSKEQILEAYINTVPFLYNAFGVEMAARTYYDVSASELDAAQSATLVGMLRGTSSYNPVRNPERSLNRRNLVLRLMAERGVLDPSTTDSLRATDLALDFERQEGDTSPHPHFTRYVRSFLSEWADRNGYDLFADGLVIHTTLDPELQRVAEVAVRSRGEQLHQAAAGEWAGGGRPFGGLWSRSPHLETRALRNTEAYRTMIEQGADETAALDSLRRDPALRDSLLAEATRLQVGFVAIEPGTGYVRAYVGSRDFHTTPFDHVRQARRQPGSVFKPFVYAAALSQGFLPGDTFIDEPTTIRVDDRRTWTPRNAGGRHTGQPMTLTEGLAYSANTVTAQLAMEVGPSRVAAVARDAGVRESPLETVPALALGTSEVTLMEMVTSYATLAASGRYHAPVPVTRIESRSGRLIAEFGGRAEQAVSGHVAQTLVHMMRGTVERGTARRIRSEFGVTADVAGKTGTSQHGADGWFLMMHPNLVAGAWVGFPEPTVTWRTTTWGQGGRNALLVVGDFFREAQSRLPESTFDTPERYREEGSIWQRTRRWWDDRFGDDFDGEFDAPDFDDESLYRAEFDYDDLEEVEFEPPPLDLDEPDDLFAGDQSEAPPEAEEPPPDDGEQTAVQRLLERTGEQLDTSPNGGPSDDSDGGPSNGLEP